MSQQELTTLLREHVERDEPPAPLPGSTVRAGRRRRRTRWMVEATAVLAVLAIAGAGVATWTHRDVAQHSGTGMDPASVRALERYDPHRMPALMDERVRGVLERTVPDLGASRFAAYDDQRSKIPERFWDKASSMELTLGAPDHLYNVSISQSPGEAEGDPDSYCNSNLVNGFSLECTVSRTDDGDVVISMLEAYRPMRMRMRMPVKPQDLDTIAMDRLWFSRTVKVIKSETLLTYVSERIKATGRDPDSAPFTTSYADLTSIGADPQLVMPLPGSGD
jgi:hypothetical protein